MNNGEDWGKETYAKAEKAIGYRFRDKELLRTCFTHKTYSNNCGGEDNERLEWLGDAVLELIVSDRLFHTDGSGEGGLTNLRKQYVSQEALTPTAEKLALMRFLRFSGGENNLGPKVPSSLVEAVIAGIYLDGGYAAAKRFLDKNFIFTEVKDYKSALQEYVQARVKETPSYSVRGENGMFTCRVKALGSSGEGTGKSIREAEMHAAEQLLQILKEREEG